MIPGWVGLCSHAGGFWLVSENRRGRKTKQLRTARQPEPGTCQVLLGLVAACPARRVLPARADEALALHGEQMLQLAVMAALHPHPECSGCLTPNISLAGLLSPTPGSTALPPKSPEGWAGWWEGMQAAGVTRELGLRSLFPGLNPS